MSTCFADYGCRVVRFSVFAGSLPLRSQFVQVFIECLGSPDVPVPEFIVVPLSLWCSRFVSAGDVVVFCLDPSLGIVRDLLPVPASLFRLNPSVGIFRDLLPLR